MTQSGGSRPAVFLDRDGVVNCAMVREGKPYPPASLAELRLVPDAKDALLRLRRAGFVLVVVTNQPDIARGTQNIQALDEIHDFLRRELELDAIYVCPHDDEDQCSCRKPAPGLLLRAAKDLDLDIRHSFLIGDRWRDIDAARGANCRGVFIDYDYRERKPASPDYTSRSLSQAVDWILEQPASAQSSLATSADAPTMLRTM